MLTREKGHLRVGGHSGCVIQLGPQPCGLALQHSHLSQQSLYLLLSFRSGLLALCQLILQACNLLYLQAIQLKGSAGSRIQAPRMVLKAIACGSIADMPS